MSNEQKEKKERKPRERKEHIFYLYDENKKCFLMSDKTFSTSGELYKFTSLSAVKNIQAFFDGTIIMTKVNI